MSFDRIFVVFFLIVPLGIELIRTRSKIRFPTYPVDIWGSRPTFGKFGKARILAVCRNALTIAGIVMLAIAAAEPVLIERSILFLDRGADVVFALDVSPSMGAKDLSPDRFGAAKAIIERFVGGERNDAVGLAAFGSDAVLVCAPTTDYDALKRRLDTLKPGDLGEGTALGTGLSLAVRHVLASRGSIQRVVLLTDGENNTGAIAPETAAMLAERNGIGVTVVGVGSKGEIPVEYVDPESGERLGGLYRSQFDEDSLRAIAMRTGGDYTSALDDAGVERVLKAIELAIPATSRKRIGSERIQVGFGWMAAACMLFVLAWCLDRFALGGLP